MASGKNDLRLMVEIDGTERPSHFKLREFANREGVAMVHKLTLVSLERARADLCAWAGEEVMVIITDATRTQADNEALAARLGYTDQGGAVARNSKHLTKWGGIAVDIKAKVKRTGKLVPQKVLGTICRRHFDWVKDDYKDGHVHADNRTRAR